MLRFAVLLLASVIPAQAGTQGPATLNSRLLGNDGVSESSPQNTRPSATAMADSVRRMIDASVVAGDAQKLDAALAMAERSLAAYPGDAWLEHYLGFAHFRASNVARGLRDEKKFKMHLDEAEKALQLSLSHKQIAESHALLSAVLGQKIGGPIDGMLLGPRADRAMAKALELGPRNPRVWAIRSSGSLYKPKLFGGSPRDAEEFARKAIEFAATDTVAAPAPTWGLSDAYTFLGQSLVALEKYPEAKAAYEKVLTLEPGNGYVTYVLMPYLLKKMR